MSDSPGNSFPRLSKRLSTQLLVEDITKAPISSPSTNDPGRFDSDYLFPGNEVFAGFRLVERISQSLSGEIWRAIRPDGVLVALRCLESTRPGVKSRLKRIGMMIPIRHDDLVASFGPWERNRWIAVGMDLADESLLDRFRAAHNVGYSGIEAVELVDLLSQAAQGIDYLNEPRHALMGRNEISLVHCAIRPASLLVYGAGLKISNFGQTQRFDQSLELTLQPLDWVGGRSLTGFSAPELSRGQFSLRSDQYSLAATFCFLRTGYAPPPCSEPAIPLDLTMLSATERPAVARALSLEPERRWPTCAAFLKALKAGIRPTVSIPFRVAPPTETQFAVNHTIRVAPEELPLLLPVGDLDQRIPIMPVLPKVPRITPSPDLDRLLDPTALIFSDSLVSEFVSPSAKQTLDPIDSPRFAQDEMVAYKSNPRKEDGFQRSHWQGMFIASGLVATILGLAFWLGRNRTTSPPSFSDQSTPVVAQGASGETRGDFAKISDADRALPSVPVPVEPDAKFSMAVESLVADPLAEIREPVLVLPMQQDGNQQRLDRVAKVRPALIRLIEASIRTLVQYAFSVAPRVTTTQPQVISLVSDANPPSDLVKSQPDPPLPGTGFVPPTTYPLLEQPAAATNIEVPDPKPTAAEIMASFQLWLRWQRGELDSQVQSWRTTGKSWVQRLSLLLPPPASPVQAQQVQVVPVPRTATIFVRMPSAKAELIVSGEVGRGNPDEWYGPTRVIHSPPLMATQPYIIGAFWTDLGGRPSTRSQPLKVEPGRHYEVDLRTEKTSVMDTGTSSDR